MTTIKAFIKRHPVLTYFALAFAISWGGILIAVGSVLADSRPPQEQFETLFPFAILAMLRGPSVAGILLTGLVYGRAGLREFLSRLLRWRVGARWYAVALLTAPLLVTAVLLALSLISPEFLPRIFTTSDKATLLLMGIAVGLVGGIFEELGWTGFAMPRLRLRYGVLDYRAHRGGAVGSVALLRELLGKRRYLRRAPPGHLPARVALRYLVGNCRPTGC